MCVCEECRSSHDLKYVPDKLFLQSFVCGSRDYSDILTLTADPVINDVKLAFFKTTNHIIFHIINLGSVKLVTAVIYTTRIWFLTVLTTFEEIYTTTAFICKYHLYAGYLYKIRYTGDTNAKGQHRAINAAKSNGHDAMKAFTFILWQWVMKICRRGRSLAYLKSGNSSPCIQCQIVGLRLLK